MTAVPVMIAATVNDDGALTFRIGSARRKRVSIPMCPRSTVSEVAALA
jgi:hypothetical protein